MWCVRTVSGSSFQSKAKQNHPGEEIETNCSLFRSSRIRCHRECEKKLSPMCPSIAQFPSPIGLVHVPPLSNHHSDSNNVFHPNASSGLPSPLLQPSQRSIFGSSAQRIPNQSDSMYKYNNSSFSAIDEQGNPSSSWQSSSVGKFMNRIVNTITTPIQAQRNPKILNNLGTFLKLNPRQYDSLPFS